MTDAPPTAESEIPRQPIRYTLGGVTIPMMETPSEAFAAVLQVVRSQMQRQGAGVLQVAAAHPFVYEAAAAVVFVAAAESIRALEQRVAVLEALHRAPDPVSIEDAIAAMRGPTLPSVDNAYREMDDGQEDGDPSDEADELEASLMPERTPEDDGVQL